MTRHHTKDKGDLAVVKVQADLVERGALVLLPLTEHAPFDVVAYLGGVFYRVQVKYRTAVEGRIEVHFRSCWADRHGTHTRPMQRDEVDVIAVYCPDTRECYYVNPADFHTSVSLRVTPPRNNQRRHVLPAVEFRTMPPATSKGVKASQLALDLTA